MQQKTKINQKDGGNPTYTNEDTNRSNLKSSSRGSILWSWFFNQMTRETELLERSQKTLLKWF